ncbi:MAG: toll/interleukin-1 receptor domain-containing protein [Lachnospiraceae bacterium]|nr:toll/interleukin-1 receptor domain-containing protein [Lachnospiraceae bacterium]
MATFKCKMCGGNIVFTPGATVGVCENCETRQTLPKLDDNRRVNLYDRANHFRRNNEFDKASAIYEQILNEDNTDAEAYWSLVLCRFGIEYVEDPATRKRMPTVNRTQFTSIFDDDNYKSALQYADASQRALYVEEAAVINGIQKEILAISGKEEPFDVFICYKETDPNGRRTPDSVLANELYYQLKQEGFKVFFARITLEDKLGTAYEPYIFAALNSAKVMVVIGTRKEYFNAVWVKNEWSRYLALVRSSKGKKTLIPAFKDMDPYDLPDEFSHLQALDMSKLGFMPDLVRGIKKLTAAAEAVGSAKAVTRGAASVAAGQDINTLLRRAYVSLEYGEWDEANKAVDKVLDIAPENAQAYLAKLLAELKLKKPEELANCEMAFDRNSSYQRAIRFGDAAFVNALNSYRDTADKKIEWNRKKKIYTEAIAFSKKIATTEDARKALQMFESVAGFQKADECIEWCRSVVVKCEKLDEKYHSAQDFERQGMNFFEKYQHQKIEISDTDEALREMDAAIEQYGSLKGWRESVQLKIALQNRRNDVVNIRNALKVTKRKRKRRIIGIVICVVSLLLLQMTGYATLITLLIGLALMWNTR